MNNNINSSTNAKNNLIFFGVIIGVALIICAFIGRATLLNVKAYGNTISVTGAASKPIQSNLAIWEPEISATSPNVEAGYAKIKSDIENVKAFMTKRGFKDSDYELFGVNVRKNYDRDRNETGVTLTQRIKMELNDVAKVTQLAREASSLLEKGVEINSYNPRYLFTGLDTLKIEMIKAATENAVLRARQLAETNGKKVGAPTSARVGVFQIRPLHSQEVSDYGISDVTSVDKEIVCTVNISFMIE